ncbi:MAG: dipeptidase [Planctomycetota bacterium]|nr:dipeptidase [Planctomycetota bacterium]
MPAPAPSLPPLSVFDAHVDSLQRAVDLGCDLGRAGRGHLDLERGRVGGLGAVVLVCWVEPCWIETTGARARTEVLLDAFHDLLERHPDRVRFAGNGREVEEARSAGVVAAIAGIEGGHSIEESLDTLEHFFERGVRVMTLVWNNHLSWIRSCQPGAGAGVPAGLSDFGRSVVRRMNELGMVVDLSHAGERSFHDALEASERPVIASHSACRALHDHPRNLTDGQLRALAAHGGVCGIVFLPSFLDAEARAEAERVRATEAYRDIDCVDPAERALDRNAYLQRTVRPLSLERVADHALHAIEVAGIEHVGIGSDFDGIDHTPEGLEDASRYPALAAALARRGLAREELELVCGANMRRVFAAATGPGTHASS